MKLKSGHIVNKWASSITGLSSNPRGVAYQIDSLDKLCDFPKHHFPMNIP